MSNCPYWQGWTRISQMSTNNISLNHLLYDFFGQIYRTSYCNVFAGESGLKGSGNSEPQYGGPDGKHVRWGSTTDLYINAPGLIPSIRGFAAVQADGSAFAAHAPHSQDLHLSWMTLANSKYPFQGLRHALSQII